MRCHASISQADVVALHESASALVTSHENIAAFTSSALAIPPANVWRGILLTSYINAERGVQSFTEQQSVAYGSDAHIDAQKRAAMLVLRAGQRFSTT